MPLGGACVCDTCLVHFHVVEVCKYCTRQEFTFPGQSSLARFSQQSTGQLFGPQIKLWRFAIFKSASLLCRKSRQWTECLLQMWGPWTLGECMPQFVISTARPSESTMVFSQLVQGRGQYVDRCGLHNLNLGVAHMLTTFMQSWQSGVE